MIKRMLKNLWAILILSSLLWGYALYAAPANTKVQAAHAKKTHTVKITKKNLPKHSHAPKKTAVHASTHVVSKHAVTKSKSKTLVNHGVKPHQLAKVKATHKPLTHHAKHSHSQVSSHATSLPAIHSGPQDYYGNANKANFADVLAQNNSSMNEDLINGGFNQMIKARLLSYQSSICANAEAQIGKPYAWGGEDPASGFDCSGLSQFVYAQEGIQIPRTALDQFQNLKPVKRLQEGDLVFFHTHEHSREVSHVGIYIGDGYFVHSPRTGENIRMSRLNDPYWREHYVGARRVLTTHVLAKNVALNQDDSVQDDS